MKTIQTKPDAAKASSHAPFFGKGAGKGLSATTEAEAPFFTVQAKLASDALWDVREQETIATNDIAAEPAIQDAPSEKIAPVSAASSVATPIQAKAAEPEQEEALTKEEETPRAPLQAKLTVGAPDDPYEQEADAVADKVVQRLAVPDVAPEKNPSVQAKPVVPAVTPLVQAKCNTCEQEEQQKEEEISKEPASDLQKKPVGGNMPDPPQDNDENDETLPKPVQRKCSDCGQEEQQIQKSPVSQTGQTPGIQKSCRECEEGDKLFLKPVPGIQRDPAGKADGSRESILAFARSQLGKVEAKHSGSGGKRVGAQYLLDYFHVAAPGVWPDSVIETAGAKMPSWCGIFAVWAHKKAGKDIGNWQMGRGVSAFGKLQQTSSPSPGDIGYIHKPYQHHCIVVKVEGGNVHTIDGNSGLYSEVKENTRPISEFTGFFTAFGAGGGASVQRKEAKEESLQKKEVDGSSSAAPSLESRLSSAKGGGSVLPESIRNDMGQAVGADFSNVRIHTGSEAVQMSQELNAQAFTHGNDIYFNEGKYDTSSKSGQHLLAHELTHTVQQGAASVQRKEVPQVQKDGGSDPVQEAIGKVYDALDGWTDSDDSYIIWNQFDSTDKAATDGIVMGVADKAGKSVDDTLEWMNADMVTSDWNRLYAHFVKANAYRVDRLIANLAYSFLSGYTSGSNSNSILAIYAGDTKVTGELLGRSLIQLEAATGYTRNDTAKYLFGDLASLDAHKLSLHFFNSGDTTAAGYAAYWIASKVESLLAGYTGTSDSTSIVENFDRVPAKLRSIVLYELETICQERWGQTAAQALMEDMQQADYEQLRVLMPDVPIEVLPVYNIQKGLLEGFWDKLVGGAEFLLGLIEYGICGLLGVIWGAITVVIDIIVAIVDVAIAVKDILGMIVYFISGGKFCKENKDRVYGFFSALGKMFTTSGVFDMMWDELVTEASLIEGPLKECKRAIFWTSRITNLLINIVLIVWAGYGAVKLALKGIEAIVTLARAGELINALQQLPAKMWTAIKNMPAAASKAILTSGSKILNMLKNPVELIATIRNSLTAIRMAAENEGYYRFLRRQVGKAIENERKFWEERRNFWKKDADKIEKGIEGAETKLADAVNNAVDEPAKSEAAIKEAENEAKAIQKETDALMDDVNGNKKKEEAIPVTPVASALKAEDFYRAPELLWGKGHEEIGKILLGEGWTAGQYSGTSDAYTFIKASKGGQSEIVINYGGGRHFRGKVSEVPQYYKISGPNFKKTKVVDGKTYPVADMLKEKSRFIDGPTGQDITPQPPPKPPSPPPSTPPEN